MCKESIEVSKDELLSQGFKEQWFENGQNKFTIFKEVGCIHCKKTGYKGREAILEVLTVTDTIKEMINKNSSPLEIFYKAQEESMHSLKQSGLRKVLQGKTSLQELKRVVL